MRNIYITGDTHSNFERINEFCHENNTSKEDLMIILGDVGVNYFEDKRDYKLKRLLENIPITSKIFDTFSKISSTFFY